MVTLKKFGSQSLIEKLTDNKDVNEPICGRMAKDVKKITQLAYTCRYFEYQYFENDVVHNLKACGVQASHQNDDDLCYKMSIDNCRKFPYCVVHKHELQ